MPTLDNAIFARFLAALELSLVVATTDTDPDIEAEKAKSLLDIGAEGLIITGAAHSTALHDLVERTMLPTIITAYYDAENPLPTIGYDNAGAAQLALQHLTDLRHQRIADAARQICALPQMPDALLCQSDVVALGVLFGLQAEDISVPGDVSLVGIDDLPSSAVAAPSITTVHLPVTQMGEKAAIALARWISDQKRPGAERLEARLVERQSVSRRKTARRRRLRRSCAPWTSCQCRG
ncbi:substrate-binding domain-containing protein [Ruegeria sp. MALMAid1280]|uniref:substrate-binding domain-containing protein n=1 Tax=Ruegeria sp. MALMAid1280 TaxID=3411634 RepID=UPI003B9F13D0